MLEVACIADATLRLPIFGTLFGSLAFGLLVVEDLALHASQFLDVFAKVAGDEFLTASGVREAWVGQLLSVRPEDSGVNKVSGEYFYNILAL